MVQKERSEKTMDFDNQIESSVDVLMKLETKTSNKKKLIDNGNRIFLQVTIFKVPELDEFVKRRISLSHLPWPGKPEVCLIVQDHIMRDRVKRAGDEMIDITIEKYKDILEKHKITGITNIMPYHQLKTEYDTFELRRKLTNTFDVFLCDARLHKKDNFFNCLGKFFFKKNKYPIAVRLPHLKQEFDPKANARIMSAIASSVFYIRPSSDNFSIHVGNTLNEKEHISANVKVVIDKIVKSEDLIPGGFGNIRAIHIKAEKSKVIPIYMSLSTGNEIPVPDVKSNVPQKESVEDEISTLPGKKVTVLPNGDVFVTRIKDRSNKRIRSNSSPANERHVDEEEEEKDEGEIEVECKNRKQANKNSKKKTDKLKKKDSLKKTSANKDDSDEYDMEDAIESAEQKYLSNLNDEYESSEDEKEKKRKLKGTKRKLKKVESKPFKKIKKEKVLQKKLKQKSPERKKVKKEKANKKL